MSEVQQKKTLGLAIASLVLGCFFIIPLLGLLTSLAALILGIIAAIKISNNKDTLKGQGLAIAGIVLGSIGIVMIPIIAMLSAIAIPNLLRARSAAQEATAASAMHTIVAAEVAYRVDNERFASLSRLAKEDPPYIDTALGSGSKQGYTFRVGAFNPEYFYVTAVPQENVVGHLFYVDEDGILCASDDTQARPIRQHIDYRGCPAGYSEYR